MDKIKGVANVWLQGQVRVAGVWILRFHENERKRERCRESQVCGFIASQKWER